MEDEEVASAKDLPLRHAEALSAARGEIYYHHGKQGSG